MPRKTDENNNELMDVWAVAHNHAERLIKLETQIDTVASAQVDYEHKTDNVVDRISLSLDTVVAEFRDFKTVLVSVWKTTLVVVPCVLTLLAGMIYLFLTLLPELFKIYGG